MKLKDVNVGICETCKHYFEVWDDPGARDCSLPGGQMLVDAGCRIDGGLIEKNNQGEKAECPLWELGLAVFCNRHKQWYHAGTDGCDKCLEEMEKIINE